MIRHLENKTGATLWFLLVVYFDHKIWSMIFDLLRISNYYYSPFPTLFLPHSLNRSVVLSGPCYHSRREQVSRWRYRSSHHQPLGRQQKSQIHITSSSKYSFSSSGGWEAFTSLQDQDAIMFEGGGIRHQ